MWFWHILVVFISNLWPLLDFRKASNDIFKMDPTQLPQDIPLTTKQAQYLFNEHVGQNITSIRKNKMNNRYTIYFVTTDKNQEFVIRLAQPLCPRRKVESEVAAMKLASRRTTIPVPHIYGWSSSTAEIGAEYIIMDYKHGDTLSNLWGTLSLDDKKQLLKELVRYLEQLNSIELDKVGSLLLSDDVQDTKPLYSPITSCLPENVPYNPNTIGCGPFESLSDFYVAEVERAISVLEKKPELAPNRDLIPQIRNFIKDIVIKRKLLGSEPITLAHGDFHGSNIIVDGNLITGIIDWERASSYPQSYDFLHLSDFLDRVAEPAENEILKKYIETEVIAKDPSALSLFQKTSLARQFWDFIFNIEAPIIPGHFDITKNRRAVLSFIKNFGPRSGGSENNSDSISNL